MTADPTPQAPASRTTEEAPEKGLQLARKLGQTYHEAIRHMVEEVATGAEKPAGDYVVAYAYEEAEGMYEMRDGRLVWRPPADGENVHLEIAVRDAADGRFIPGLKVTVSLQDRAGNHIGQNEHPFLWHPWLYHYGRNWALPGGDGTYDILVRIEPPTFARHDKVNGQRYMEPVEVEWRGVPITTGVKKA